ncbi:MAG: O-antigen ligase family protein [Lachnospiraceae bacterium]|nr:O-antigen ligase family protein [Lachnospiraceae bacterium]
MEKRFEYLKENGDIFFAVMFTLLLLISFISEKVYETAGRYSSLFMFFLLIMMLFPYIPELVRKKDIRIIAVILTGSVSMINLILLDSNKGAVLIPSDMVLIALASSCIRLRENVRIYIAAAGSFFTTLWYIDVRWSYNFNMAGLTFMLFMIMGVIFLEQMKDIKSYEYLFAVQILMYVTAFIYAILYHSRCAMAAILVFGLCVVCGRFILRSKLLFSVLLALTTAGSIAFTFIYILLGSRGFHMRFLYKDLLSGRQQIWKELWGAFTDHPFTGIGSSYELKSFDIFEVHNGFFDILAVHGIIVFLLVFIMVLSAVNSAWISAGKNDYDRNLCILAIAAVFAMFTASFFENFFIVPPYSAFFMYFLLICREE